MANTTTSVVQVTTIDEEGKSKTFNIDNPKANLSLNEIRQALKPAFDGRFWLGNGGAVITTLKSANYSTSEKIPIEGSDAIITVTPNQIILQRHSAVQEVTVTVEGSNVTGAYFSDMSDISTWVLTVRQNPQDKQQLLIVSNFGATDWTATATLNIITEAKAVQIPLMFAQS